MTSAAWMQSTAAGVWGDRRQRIIQAIGDSLLITYRCRALAQSRALNAAAALALLVLDVPGAGALRAEIR